MSPVQTFNSDITIEAPSPTQRADDRILRMQIRHEEIESDIGSIYLIGRLDILGVQEIELKFTAMTSAQRKSVIVDLSKVDLMNSIGLGMLITNANTLKSHGKVMILLNPQPRVERVVRIACLDELLPIEYNIAEALRRIKANGN